MNLGSMLQELRKNKNITQEQVARELGVSVAAVSKWETNNSLPDILTLINLADYFEISLDEMTGRNQVQKKALLLTEYPDLSQKLKELLEQYRIILLKQCTELEAAKEYCNQNDLDMILVAGRERKDTVSDEFPDKTVILSVSENEEEILKGFEFAIKNFPQKYSKE